MDIDAYRSVAEAACKQGCIKDVDFSHATYQIEVFDIQEDESYWPFFQLNEKGEIRDAFCSCPSDDDEGCWHLAAAYLKIFNGHNIPLHLRFAHSFYNALGFLTADRAGYGTKAPDFTIEAQNNEGERLLKGWLGQRPKVTPENSIKFSNLPAEEVEWWREGRPSPALRYDLSFWSDVAKWMLLHNEQASITFSEDETGLPLRLEVQFPEFVLSWTLSERDLKTLIPTLGTVNASLKLLESAAQKVEDVVYDAEGQRFVLKHGQGEERQGKMIGEWIYTSKVGFTPRDGASLLSRDTIEAQDIPAFLEAHGEQLDIPVNREVRHIRYVMQFDEKWNWHFSAYVEKQGENLQLFEGWAYIEGEGFFRVEDKLFEETEKTLTQDDVSTFVSTHRIWLNGQEGFQTHLASIESQLTYSLTEKGNLIFQAKAHAEGADTHDFGEWIYYEKQGFFSKKHARAGGVVRPGLEVVQKEVGRFIKKHASELENIPRFFTTDQLVDERGLEVRVKSASSIHVKPVYKGRKGALFFGTYAYVEGIGFCELPIGMRLPEGYEKERTIGHDKIAAFITDDLPQLEKYIISCDPRLKTPLKCDLEVHYLVRTGAGGLKAQLFFLTEHGKIPVPEIYAAYQKKRRYVFTDGGMLDLHELEFQWIKTLSRPVDPELQTVELTTLEFMRLDASLSPLGPPDDVPTAEITRKLLRELRDFSAHEKATTKGLESTLRQYQQTGLQWLWFLYKNGLSALLCDDMGLGKTHQAMALMAATLNQQDSEKKRFLVVCPTSVIYHWQDKLETFLPKMKVHTFHGLKRSLKNLPKEGLILTTYGILRMEKKSIEKIPFEVAVYDEIQVAKNPSSRVHEALTHVQARMRIGLTGTPIENNLRELKALFDIVLPGYMPSEARFRELFVNPIERDLNEEKKTLLTGLIRPFVLRRRKTEVLQELPEKSEDKSYCDLSAEQLKLYKGALQKDREDLIDQLRDRETKVNFIHVFALLSHLKQVCNHPALLEKDPHGYKNYESGKWDLFVQLLDEAIESEQKVVVFSQYLHMLDIMEAYLKEKGWNYAQIRGDTKDRREQLKRFQEDPNCKVFIGSLQAAGLGIDLTAASVVIMYDRWWNAARENQAIDRVHRMGQKWGVQVYKLITKGTIEEKIDRMITKKGQLMEEIVTADDQAVLKKFSRSDLIDLLTYVDPEE